MFLTLQDRLPKELELNGITTMKAANKYLKKVYLLHHDQQFCVKEKIKKSAYIPWIGDDLNEILCYQEERVVQNDNTVGYEVLQLQIPRDDFSIITSVSLFR